MLGGIPFLKSIEEPLYLYGSSGELGYPSSCTPLSAYDIIYASIDGVKVYKFPVYPFWNSLKAFIAANISARMPIMNPKRWNLPIGETRISNIEIKIKYIRTHFWHPVRWSNAPIILN